MKTTELALLSILLFNNLFFSKIQRDSNTGSLTVVIILIVIILILIWAGTFVACTRGEPEPFQENTGAKDELKPAIVLNDPKENLLKP